MKRERPLTGKNATSQFDVAAASMDNNLVALVRHLARISAENDYKVFLKSLETRYGGEQPKGPLQ